MTWRLRCQINVTSKLVTWSQYQAKKTVINKVQIVDQTWRFFRVSVKVISQGSNLYDTNPYICIKFDPPPQTGSVAFNGLPVTHGGSGKKKHNEREKPMARASASFVGSVYDAVFLALHVEAELISAPGSNGERDVVILAILCGNRKPWQHDLFVMT